MQYSVAFYAIHCRRCQFIPVFIDVNISKLIDLCFGLFVKDVVEAFLMIGMEV